jgi:hypothetical protein
MPLTAAGLDKIGPSGLSNRIVRLSSLEQELPAFCLIRVPIHFGNSVGESTTSTMKHGDSDTNVSDLNKNNIIEPTLNHLLEEDRKVFEAYHKEVDEIFMSCYEVTWQGLVQKDATRINIHKSEVTPEVWSNPLLSLDDVQIMINSALERKVKSSNALV